MKMIIKFSWMLYKRMMAFNKLLAFHYLIIIPLTGYIVYSFFEESDGYFSVNPLSYILFYMFMFQSLLLIGKRIKNEFFFSSRCYTLFPFNKVKTIFNMLLFGFIDPNVTLLIIVTFGMVIFVTKWSLSVYIVFTLIFIVVELVYLVYMMVIIEYILGRYETTKNLFLIAFFPFMFLEFYTRLSGNFHLFDFYPMSGWIGSLVDAAIKGDKSQVLFFFGIALLAGIIGLIFLSKVTYPRKNYVF